MSGSAEHARPPVNQDGDITMNSVGKSLSTLLEETFPSKTEWSCSETTSIIYHETGCTICQNYVTHVVKDCQAGDQSMHDTLDKVQDHYIE